MKKTEEKKIVGDWEWWKELEKDLPWRLYGFSYRNFATFFTPSNTVRAYDTIQLTGEQRDQIINAIRR